MAQPGGVTPQGASSSVAAAATPNPATPQTSSTPAAQSTTQQAVVQQTTTTSQQAATTPSTTFQFTQQPLTTSTPVAASTPRTTSTAIVPSSSARSSTTSVPVPSVASTTHSSSTASSSRTTSSSTSAIIAGVSASSSAFDASVQPKLSNAAIGGIVGGAVGGLIIIALAFLCWRRNRNTAERVPPPPPRDMTYVTSTYHKNRTQPGLEPRGATINRASSYSTLLAARPSSTYQSHSRHQSAYYNTYPIATPSTDASPPMEPMEVESPPFTGAPSSGNTTPGSAGVGGGNGKPVLAVHTGSLRRGDSSSSSSEVNAGPARRMPSIDRLRSEAGASDRAGSPSNMMYPFPAPVSGQSSEPGSSGPSSPHPSSHSHQPSVSAGYPSPSSHSHARMSSLSPNTDGRYPRPLSMASLSSSRYLHVGPAGGAPHQGRPINLEMPKLLGARPDQSGDFFNGMPRMEQGQMASFDSMPQMPAMYPAYSVPSKSYSERDMIGEMGQQRPRRQSSSQTLRGADHPNRRSYTGSTPPMPPMPPVPQGSLAFPQPRRMPSTPSETSSQGSTGRQSKRRPPPVV